MLHPCPLKAATVAVAETTEAEKEGDVAIEKAPAEMEGNVAVEKEMKAIQEQQWQVDHMRAAVAEQMKREKWKLYEVGIR